jgi:hypothetical protein
MINEHATRQIDGLGSYAGPFSALKNLAALTFGVSCSSDQDIEGACRYEWWQDKSGSFPGKYSIYHQICKTS